VVLGADVFENQELTRMQLGQNLKELESIQLWQKMQNYLTNKAQRKR
jgi:hypothetical protein